MENRAFKNANDAYYCQTKSFLWNLIPDGQNKIMDIGCASGQLGRYLLERNKVKEIVGIELFEHAALEAMKHYNKVYVGDIENISMNYENYFDVTSVQNKFLKG